MTRSAAARGSSLTDNEGSVLGLVARRQPVSTYQLLRIFEQSPVTSLNHSKGTIYPVVRRLQSRGFLAGRELASDARKTEVLRCTAKGYEALRQWVMTVPASAILLEDPLRTRLLSFDVLTAEERREWVRTVRHLVAAKVEEIREFGVLLQIPFRSLVFQNLELGLEARDRWLENVEEVVGKEGGDPETGQTIP